MAFNVSTKLGSAYGESFNVQDGRVNTDLVTIPLIGSSAPPGYAQSLAKSLIDILSNSASNPADKPSKPLIGQTWFDFSTKSLKVWTSSEWRKILTDGASDLLVQPNQGGLGITPTAGVAGYIIRVNTTGTGYEYSPGSYVRTDASSAPTTNATFDIGTSTKKFNNIFANTFNGNSTSSDKWSTARTITLTGHVSGTVTLDGTANTTMTTTLVGGTLSQYIKRTGDSMDPGVAFYGGIGESGGFRFPNDAYGGSGDNSGMVLTREGTTENCILTLFSYNDPTDRIHIASGELKFFTTNSNGAPQERITVKPTTGFVGINNVAPQYQLHVTGDVAVSQMLLANTCSINDATLSTLKVNGTSVLSGNLTVTADATINKVLTSNLVMNVNSNFAVDGTAKFGNNLTVTGIITAGDVLVSASDVKLKTNIKPIRNALDTIKQISAYSFDYDRQECEQSGFTPAVEHDIGLMANEVGAAIPEAMADNGRYLNYRERPVLAMLVAAIKELDERLTKLGV